MNHFVAEEVNCLVKRLGKAEDCRLRAEVLLYDYNIQEVKPANY